MKIRVGLVGYGTIGKRVADAVALQEDMELVGITGNSYNYKMAVAAQKGYGIYTVASQEDFLKNGIKPAGTFDDLLKKVDVVVDCTPKKIGAANKEKYTKAGVKAIYQGGEKATIAEASFVAQCNYDMCLNKNHVRVVSCNTTGLARTIHAINQKWPVSTARANLIRRGTDPNEHEKGPINAIVPSLELPSHHGPDVRTVLPEVEVFTTAVIVPTTLMHLHALSVRLKHPGPTAADIIKLFEETPRIKVLKAADDIGSTAQIMDYARDLGRNRGDMMEICVWEEGVGVYGQEVFFMQAVHQESDVVPENIDAIRAVMGFKDGKKSIEMTDRNLGIASILGR
ncbi:type II glyceraldehyde-3-phosphate dehydrogenase [Candidatus Woesearchaeota archaeon]|nr:type II glyceraldehyde-3-phosphate dehydrogenase [Candidatus Woesearchaeota archaeon]